jgi:hypothetical protein
MTVTCSLPCWGHKSGRSCRWRVIQGAHQPFEMRRYCARVSAQLHLKTVTGFRCDFGKLGMIEIFRRHD